MWSDGSNLHRQPQCRLVLENTNRRSRGSPSRYSVCSSFLTPPIGSRLTIICMMITDDPYACSSTQSLTATTVLACGRLVFSLPCSKLARLKVLRFSVGPSVLQGNQVDSVLFGEIRGRS